MVVYYAFFGGCCEDLLRFRGDLGEDSAATNIFPPPKEW